MDSKEFAARIQDNLNKLSISTLAPSLWHAPLWAIANNKIGGRREVDDLARIMERDDIVERMAIHWLRAAALNGVMGTLYTDYLDEAEKYIRQLPETC